MSGEHVDVHHPEELNYSWRRCRLFAADGTPTLFDHESVSEVVGKTNGRRKTAS
jgi:hypothetical protein